MEEHRRAATALLDPRAPGGLSVGSNPDWGAKLQPMEVQLCIVHQVRASLNYVSWKQRKAVAVDLQMIYRASTSDDAYFKLEAFAEKWDGAYPTISQMWRRNWEHLTPFFAYPADIRKVIYTTNAIESLNMSLRKVIKTRGSFPNADAALKLIFLALEHIAKK